MSEISAFFYLTQTVNAETSRLRGNTRATFPVLEKAETLAEESAVLLERERRSSHYHQQNTCQLLECVIANILFPKNNNFNLSC